MIQTNARQGYKGPVSATDIIIEYSNNEKSGIILITRKFQPYGIALPGGFAELNISLDQNAIKEAKEETGLEVIIEKPENPFMVLSNPNRDPRDHIISHVYVGKGTGTLKAGDDAKTANLYSINEVKELLQTVPFAFDHEKILKRYLQEKGEYE